MNLPLVAEFARVWPAKPISGEIGYGPFPTAARLTDTACGKSDQTLAAGQGASGAGKLLLGRCLSLLLTACLVAMSCGCGPSAAPPPAAGPDVSAGQRVDNRQDEPVVASKADPFFADITASSKLTAVHDVGKTSKGTAYFMPRCVGSGAAFLDFDADGRLDIYLLQNAGPDSLSTNRLFRQDAEGQFADVSDGCGLDVAGYGMGVAVGDVNNDGKTDVLVTEYGRARLFINHSDGPSPRFIDITDQAGLGNRLWGTSSCFFDYDRDGLLDLVLVNYINYDPSRWCADAKSKQDFCGPGSFQGQVTKLFHNLGPKTKNPGKTGAVVRFEDVTVASGLAAAAGPGLGVFCADFDGDRWADIFVANDGKPNHLWINRRDGTFKEEATPRGIGYNSMGKSEADMGVAIGDVDGDGNFDLFVTHLTTETNTLWLQKPRGIFSDRTAASKLTASAWRGTGFGTVMADFDNDGALDLAIANGRVRRGKQSKAPASFEDDSFWDVYRERDQLFLGDGKGGFRDVSGESTDFSGAASVSRGLVCGDVDNDGALDLLVTRIGERPSLYRNVIAGRGHWLLVRAVDPKLKRDAYGAEVYVRMGNRRLMRWINPGYSFLCSNDPRAHFGLGSSDRIDAINVVWPDGVEETFAENEVDRLVVLRRGEGQTVSGAENQN